MATEMNWKCHQCGMVFQSHALLQKHRDRFCVGLGESDEFLIRQREVVEITTSKSPENDPPTYNPKADPKLRELAENHGRNMEYLHNRNRDLERQREEIRRRLEELGRRPIKGDDSTAALLQELREQEARNQRLLEELRRQLLEARGPINIYQQMEERQKGKPFSYPIYYGNSLVAEISAIRQAYLQNGGTDPEILAQMAQMLAEAQAIEDAMRNAQAKNKVRDKQDPSMMLSTLELENQRLQRELLLLQEQNIISKNRRKDDREDDLDRELRRLQRDHLRKIYELQHQLESLRRDMLIEHVHYNEKPTSLIIQHAAPPPPPQVVEVDALMPYDPYPRVILRPTPRYAHTWVATQHRHQTAFDPVSEIEI